MCLSKTAEASRVLSFLLKMLTLPMGQVLSLLETPPTSSDGKLQSNTKQLKEVAPRTTPIK